MPVLPPCLSCGTCCFSTIPEYVRVYGSDYARLGASADQLVSFNGHRAYMRMADGHCLALVISGGKGEYVCSTYDTRPQVCRELGRGSPACLGERTMKSERPPASLRLSRTPSNG